VSTTHPDPGLHGWWLASTVHRFTQFIDCMDGCLCPQLTQALACKDSGLRPPFTLLIAKFTDWCPTPIDPSMCTPRAPHPQALPALLGRPLHYHKGQVACQAGTDLIASLAWTPPPPAATQNRLCGRMLHHHALRSACA